GFGGWYPYTTARTDLFAYRVSAYLDQDGRAILEGVDRRPFAHTPHLVTDPLSGMYIVNLKDMVLRKSGQAQMRERLPHIGDGHLVEAGIAFANERIVVDLPLERLHALRRLAQKRTGRHFGGRGGGRGGKQ